MTSLIKREKSCIKAFGPWVHGILLSPSAYTHKQTGETSCLLSLLSSVHFRSFIPCPLSFFLTQTLYLIKFRVGPSESLCPLQAPDGCQQVYNLTFHLAFPLYIHKHHYIILLPYSNLLPYSELYLGCSHCSADEKERVCGIHYNTCNVRWSTTWDTTKDKPPVKRQVNRKVCDDINTDIKILSTVVLYKGWIGCR